jgi:hypothetical protein
VETQVSAKHLREGSIPSRASINMSVEHGHGHAKETVQDIIGILFLSLLAFPYILNTSTEAFEAIFSLGENGHSVGH